jgi:small-conductance mechanosensitive channel
MDNIEHDVKVLHKILNSELFLGNYPMINRVWVEEYGTNKIDIVLSVKEPANEYWPVRDEVKKSIHNLAKMAGVKTRFNIYP